MTLARLDVYRIMELSFSTRRRLLKKYDPGFDAEVNYKGPVLGDALRRIQRASSWDPMMVEVREWHDRVEGKR